MPPKMLLTNIQPLLMKTVVPGLEFLLVARQRRVWRPIFSSILPQPRMVMPTRFHWNRPSHFPSR